MAAVIAAREYDDDEVGFEVGAAVGRSERRLARRSKASCCPAGVQSVREAVDQRRSRCPSSGTVIDGNELLA
jgi:hypothetical protein